MADAQYLQRLIAAHSSVSDKIRALDRAGLSRAEIARVLQKRYQHVRNVLEGDKLRHGTGATSATSKLSAYRPTHSGETAATQESEPPPSSAPLALFRIAAQQDGSVVLPRYVLDAFGAAPGDMLTGVARPGELVLRTPSASVARAQELVRSLIPGDDSLADALVADRRRETEDERRDG